MFKKEKTIKTHPIGVSVKVECKSCAECYDTLYNAIKELEYKDPQYCNYNVAIDDVLIKLKEICPGANAEKEGTECSK